MQLLLINQPIYKSFDGRLKNSFVTDRNVEKQTEGKQEVGGGKK